MADWVELRIHGVSGTPPESLLGRPHVRQVAGDDYSRFFRAVGAAGDEIRPSEPDEHVLEGYHWGRFTSGTWRQGLTLLLVPFGLVNATQFMLPEPESRWGKWFHAVAGACLRGIALVLTLLLTFAGSLIFIDLIGWRWAHRTRLLDHYAPDLVLMGAVVASALVVLALAFLGYSRLTRRPAAPDLAASDAPTELGRGSFYDVNPNAPTLRVLHLAAGLTEVAVLADLARRGNTPDAGGGSFTVVLWALMLAVVVVVLVLGDPEGAVGISWGNLQPLKERWRGLARGLAYCLLVGAGVLLVASVARLHGVSPQTTGDAEQRLVSFDDIADDLMIAGLVALSVLYVVMLLHLWRGPGFSRWSRRDAADRLLEVAPPLVVGCVVGLYGPAAARPIGWVVAAAAVVLALWAARSLRRPGTTAKTYADYFRPYAGGMTPFLLSSVAVFLGIGLSAAAATAVSSSLELDVDQDKTKVGTTPMLDRVAYAWGITIALVVVLVLALVLLYFASKKGYGAKVDAMYARPATETTVLPEGWRTRVVRAVFLARIKNLLPVMIVAFSAFGMLISGVQAYETLGCDPTVPAGGSDACPQAPGLLDWLSQPRSSPASIFGINTGAWILLAGAGLLVTVSKAAVRDSTLRRGINVVWDVFSFWPHAVHPFVPKPYSRWTVPEVRNRIRWHLENRVGTTAAEKPQVVLSAHSQGSLISSAALMLLTKAERERVAFLSCGSQLRVIYPRAFPAYVNLGSVDWLFTHLGGRWVNLFRATDPLAGPVLSWAHQATGSQHFPLAPCGPVVVVDSWPPDTHRCRRSGNDWRLIDPIAYDKYCEEGPVDTIRGHHDYWLDPNWAEALRFLRTP